VGHARCHDHVRLTKQGSCSHQKTWKPAQIYVHGEAHKKRFLKMKPHLSLHTYFRRFSISFRVHMAQVITGIDSSWLLAYVNYAVLA